MIVTEHPLDKLKRSVVCPVELSLRVLGGKWRGSILYQLIDGPLRFNELKLRVQDAVVDYHKDEDHILSSKVLSEHLTQLANYGLVMKEKNADENSNCTYKLTPKGESVIPILLDLFFWGEENL